MHWLYLALAILADVVATSCLKASVGFTRLWPSLAAVAGYAVAFFFLALTLRTLPVGVTYAVWSGVGTVLTAIIGIWYFKETATAMKMVSIGLIVIGVMGLHSASRLAPA